MNCQFVRKKIDCVALAVAFCEMSAVPVPMLFVAEASPACVVAQTRSAAGLFGFANEFPPLLVNEKFVVLPTT